VVAPLPHLWLTCRATPLSDVQGRWSFSLESIAGTLILEAEDCEEGDLNTVALVGLIRGLEAIEGPSAVTLWTDSGFVAHGLQYGLPDWREQDFLWEHFGSLRPIRYDQLWRRADHALQIHSVALCRMQVSAISGPQRAPAPSSGRRRVVLDPSLEPLPSPALPRNRLPAAARRPRRTGLAAAVA
jgi:ribonuclease HI